MVFGIVGIVGMVEMVGIKRLTDSYKLNLGKLFGFGMKHYQVEVQEKGF